MEVKANIQTCGSPCVDAKSGVGQCDAQACPVENQSDEQTEQEAQQIQDTTNHQVIFDHEKIHDNVQAVNLTTSEPVNEGVVAPEAVSNGNLSVEDQSHVPVGVGLHNQGMLFLNITDLQNKVMSANPSQGNPVLVLASNPDKGTIEANVVFDDPNMARLVKMQTIHGIQTFVSADTLQQNEIVTKGHKPAAERYYLCGFEGCGRSFSSMGYLKYHQVVHNGEKTLKCNFEGCNRKFSWPAHLKYHQMTHTGERKYTCSHADCNKNFITAQRLAVHMRTHTGEKPFVCHEDGCNKTFLTAGNLKNHLRTHTGERPYVCCHEGCNRRFAEHSSLRKHQVTHTGEKRFTCTLCGKAFSQCGSRNAHMKKHQNKKHKKSQQGFIMVDVNSQNIMVLDNNKPEPDLYPHYNMDFQAESVVFSHAATDHVVTVTTQPADGELDLSQSMLVTEEVLASDDPISSAIVPIPPHSDGGGNVVVLSQPQEMVSMTTGYHHSQAGSREEIVYDSDLHTALDHEEMAQNIELPVLPEQKFEGHMTQSHSIAEASHAQTMDPMMELDENDGTLESDHEHSDKLTIMCE